jgi:hypothetical protein
MGRTAPVETATPSRLYRAYRGTVARPQVHKDRPGIPRTESTPSARTDDRPATGGQSP